MKRQLIRRDVDLTWLNSYRVQARAQICAFPRTEEDLRRLMEIHPVWKLIGHGNNIILSQTLYRQKAPIICMREFKTDILVEGNMILAGAGASLRAVCLAAAREGLGGLEPLWDIPSSLGGAVYMNAGAYGHDLHEVVERVRVFDSADGTVRDLTKTELGTGYRRSRFQEQSLIVLDVALALTPRDRALIWSAMGQVGALRRRRFPYETPNAGSVFKRPEGEPVGRMSEALGLKGIVSGGAQVSRLHGGFIVNIGEATGGDILALADRMKRDIEASYQVELQLEQVVI